MRSLIILSVLVMYGACLVIKKPNDSKGASDYWAAKAHETRVDTTTSIVVYSILGSIVGIPIALLVMGAVCVGISYPILWICKKRSKKREETVEETVETL